MIIFNSCMFGGRASDKQIVINCGILSLLEPNDTVMVDKGFHIDDKISSVWCQLVRPPFLRRKERFTVAEGIENADIAAVRVHVERAIQ